MELLGKLGVDWRLLLAQIVNFLALLFVLKKFLYGPVIDLLNERTKKIEKSLEQARSIEETLEKTNKERGAALQKARQEASKVIEEAELSGEKIKKDLAEKAKSDVGRIIERGKIQIREEKEAMLKEARKELADLVLLLSERVLAETAQPHIHRTLVEKTIRAFKKSKTV